ncbi:MAG: acyltransferase family protein [Actinomadura sp.]
MPSVTVAAPRRTPIPQHAGPSRLGWVDALRGVAALMVAFQHAAYRYVPHLQGTIQQWFDPGTYGVMVFFLVSGYIVPASLARGGSVRRFWISRLFRIYPLWALASAIIAAMALTGVAGWRAGLDDLAPPTAVLAHVTMLQDLLAVPNAINVLWTLSYEMAFYLLVVALFTVRLDGHPAGVACGLAVAGVTLGGLLPTAVLSRAAGVDVVVALVTVLMAVAVCCAVAGPATVRTAGALLGGALGLVLVAVNSRTGAWEGFTILAVMFAGTAVRHAESGRLGRRPAALTTAVVVGCAVAAGVWHSRAWELPAAAERAFQRGWTVAVVTAALTFALGLALRNARPPRWLAGLGLMSYSVYLLHPVLLLIFDQVVGRPRHDSPAMLAGAIAMVLAVSWGTYRIVEAPMQRCGRRLGHRLERRPKPAATEPSIAPAVAAP